MKALRLRDKLEYRRELREKDPFSLLSHIGNIPLIEIYQLAKHLKGVQIFSKAEWLNPGGSVKDRAGQFIEPIKYDAYFNLVEKGKYQVMILLKTGDQKRTAGFYYEVK